MSGLSGNLLRLLVTLALLLGGTPGQCQTEDASETVNVGSQTTRGDNTGKEKANGCQEAPAGGAVSNDIDELIKQGLYEKASTLLAEQIHKAHVKKSDPLKIAGLLEKLAIAERKRERLRKAEDALKQAVAAVGIKGEGDGRADIRARILFELTDLLDLMGAVEEGLKLVDQAIAAARALELEGNMPYHEAEMLNVQARMLTKAGIVAKAGKILNEASYMVETLPDEPAEMLPVCSPISSSKSHLKGKVLLTRALLNRTLGKLKKAAEQEEQANELLLAASGMSDDYRYAAIVGRFESEKKRRTDEDSKALRRDFLEDLERQRGANSLITSVALEYFADRDLDIGKNLEQVEETLSNCLKTRKRILPARSDMVLRCLIKLARTQLARKKLSKAAENATQAYRSSERSPGARSPLHAEAAVALADAYLAAGSYRSLEPILLRAWAVQGNLLGQDSLSVLEVRERLTQLYYRTRNYVKAIKTGLPLLVELDKVYGAKSEKLVPSLVAVGSSCAYKRKFKLAEKNLARAKAILKTSGRQNTPEYGEALAGEGVCFSLQYDWKRGEQMFKDAIGIYSRSFGVRHPNTLAMRRLRKQMRGTALNTNRKTHNLLLSRPIQYKKPDHD